MAAGPDGALSLWDVCIALISGGALTGSISGLYLIGRKVGRAETNIEDLQMRVKKQEDGLDQYIEKNDRKSDTRHEANLAALHRIDNTVASAPSKQDFQRLEDYLRTSVAEIKQMFMARGNVSPRRSE